MPVFSSAAAFSRVTALAGQRPVHAAFSWLHVNPKTILDWQIDVASIPAPSNSEQERALWLKERFLEAGVSAVETDAAGNVLGVLPAAHLPAESTGHVVVLSAHLDTVFPASTLLRPAIVNDRLEAPGACDNAAGIVGMMAVVYALIQAEVELPAPLVVLGNVGEEGEGDLRGVRHFYQHNSFAGRVAAHIVLDGAGTDAAVTQALGSRRYRVNITGPGGHSFTDAGKPNPIAALATALAKLAETPLPEEPRTTLNLGTVRGGISVNSIPPSAEATVDFRSTEPSELLRLEVALHRAVEDAVEHWNARSTAAGDGTRGRLAFEIVKIGDRPAAVLPGDSPLLAGVRAVDR
ncbi:MAG: M20/M25/M40 family metallo-hydrolase, partial [Terracidiphilus sp.]